MKRSRTDCYLVSGARRPETDVLLNTEDCMDVLRCPVTKGDLVPVGDKLGCGSGVARDAPLYPVVGGKPILIDFDNSILNRSVVEETSASSGVERRSYAGPKRFIKKLLSPEQTATRENVAKLHEMLAGQEEPARLLVVGGGSIGRGMEPLYDEPSIHLYSFDIYSTPFVQFVADAHDMPLPDDLFDGVIVQAVLEHVLEPLKVVDEIFRVLKPEGVVYAETPFMQQVHEGAYDFTRYTESGHRFLFKDFELISSGVCGGPGMQLMWSVDYFLRGIFRSRTAGKIGKLLFFWAQYFDRVMPHRYALDGASGTFFLGRKPLEPKERIDIVAHYKGAM